MGLTETLRSVTGSLVGSHGKSVTYRRKTTTYDPSTGVSSVSWEDTSMKGIITSYEINRVNGTTILSGDRSLMVPAYRFAEPPVPGDQFVIGSDAWFIVSVSGFYHGEQAVGYNLQIRGGVL
jgi:hypothetical protein